MTEPTKLADALVDVIDQQKKQHPENALQWEMVKTLSMLIDRVEYVGDKLFDLYQRAEEERIAVKTEMFKKYITQGIKEIEHGKQFPI